MTFDICADWRAKAANTCVCAQMNAHPQRLKSHVVVFKVPPKYNFEDRFPLVKTATFCLFSDERKKIKVDFGAELTIICPSADTRLMTASV